MHRMTSPLDFTKRLQLLYQNMLPIMKRPIPYDQVIDERTLLRLARDAEKLILDKRNYVPPPLQRHAVFPELAHKEDSQARAPPQPQLAIPAISESENVDNKADLSTILSILQALWQEFHLPRPIRPSKNQLSKLIMKVLTVRIRAHLEVINPTTISPRLKSD